MSEKQILKNLEKGIRPEEALSDYVKTLGSSYLNLSYCKLACNFLNYYDDLEQAEGLEADSLRQIFADIQKVMQEVLIEGNTGATAYVEEVLNYRKCLLKQMQQMFDYVHVLAVYEYLIYRCDFKVNDRTDYVDTEVLMDTLHQYFSASDDPAEVNDRIQKAYGEMPIRMTKNLFFEIVRTSCACYEGTRSDIADHFFELMEEQSVLPHSDMLTNRYSDLHMIVCDLERMDLGHLEKEQVKRAMDELEIAGQQIGKTMAYQFQLVELINDLLIILLNLPNTCADETIQRMSISCISAYMHAANTNNFMGIDEDIVGSLEKLNEKQQKLSGMHMLFEDQLDALSMRYASIISLDKMKTVWDVLLSSRILSGIDLTAKIDLNQPVFMTDGEYIKKKVDILIDKYKEMFNNYPIMIRRAVIADALSKLPIAGNSLEEAESLLRQNLENCKDKAELAAASEQFKILMQDDNR